MFLSKQVAFGDESEISFNTILRNIELFRIKENSKVSIKRKRWTVNDFSTIDPQNLRLFAHGKTAYKSLLIKNIGFFHPGDLTECSNEIHQQQMMILIEALIESLGYEDNEDRIFYFKYAFDEIFKNARRGQMKKVIPSYNSADDVQMSIIMTEIEKKNLIPDNKKLRIKVDLLTEGFSLKIFSPVMSAKDASLVSERMKVRLGSSNKLDYTNELAAELKTKSDGEGNGIYLARRSLHRVHPAYGYTVNNIGNYTVTTVTLPKKIEHE